MANYSVIFLGCVIYYLIRKEMGLISSKQRNIGNMSLLDLPELTLNLILERLSPAELCKMSEVCTCLRDRCRSEHVWEKKVKQKWGRVIGDLAYKEWQFHITTTKERTNLGSDSPNPNYSVGSFIRPNACLCSFLMDCSILNGPLSNHFMMSLYISLETGTFHFPAQVYSLEWSMILNALVFYHSQSNTFRVSITSVGPGFQANGLEWDMVRAPAVDFYPYDLHDSDCLDNLIPGDHIEIQWRGIQNHYAWRYAVIGHLKSSCSENESYCQCHRNPVLILEFKQYPEGSSQRRITLYRKNGEQGDEILGYYGGIRKLHNQNEIETWERIFSGVVKLNYHKVAALYHDLNLVQYIVIAISQNFVSLFLHSYCGENF